MALTGLEIYKHLPKTNCKDCGLPTCLAFAMKMATKQISLDKCPHVTAAGKAALESSSRPPIQLVVIGSGDAEVKIGNETQLYRHEEKFHRPTAIAVKISDALDDAAFGARAATIGKLRFERVGMQIGVNLIAVDNESGDAGRFEKAAALAAEKSGLACVLMSSKAQNLDKAVGDLPNQRPLLYISDPAQAEAAAKVAKQANCPLAVKADGLDALAELTAKIAAAGVEEMVLDPGTRGVKATLENLSKIRRLSLKNFRPLGYPTIAFTASRDPTMQVVEASTYVAKYAGVVVTDAIEKWQMMPILTTRQDIYTDPQKPVAVEPKLYAVGEVGPDSPLLVTTNFSLSYYSVEGEVEASRVPAYILAVDTEGTSVLTAWASDKFNADTINKALKKSDIERELPHRSLVIPGFVAVLTATVEDETGWSVRVGPKEASGIPAYLKKQWKSSRMASFHIRFLPEGRETAVDEGKTLLEAARAANVHVGAICGGEGTCGKCRLIVRHGEVDGNAVEFFTRDEIRHGYVLACQAVPLSDLEVEVPLESRLTGYVGIVQDSERFRDFVRSDAERAPAELHTLVKKFFLILPEPTVDDPTADQERLLEAVAKRWPGPLQIGLKAARELPRLLRHFSARGSAWSWQWNGRVTATVGCRRDVNEVLCVERGDTSERNFGLALDVGTTTVVGHLVDLRTGATREAAAKYNSQIEYGANVISRINYARQPGGAETLQRAILQDIDTLITDIAERAEIGRGDIHCVVAAGNTAMLHFVLGIEADLIRVSPFVPAIASPPPLRAAEVSVRIHPRGTFYTMPMVGSYVGGDITAGILASGMYNSPELALLLDIGTNGEVVLGNKEFMVACSASAGPAFEGGSVTCGMRATRGAIDSMRILPDELIVSTTTIDDSPPLGVCGTGLIDALAEMFLVGLLDRSGRFQVDRAPDRFRTSAEDGQPEFVLIRAWESGAWDIVLRQTDIENLIRTKGAIYAAADSLIRSVGLSFADVQKIYIAGEFGNRLDIASCITIGLLPDVPADRFCFIGNSSAAGAKLAMLNRHLFDEVQRIRDRITYQELMVDPAYMENFLSACFLPHTDLSRFPSAAQNSERRAKPAPQVEPSRST